LPNRTPENAARRNSTRDWKPCAVCGVWACVEDGIMTGIGVRISPSVLRNEVVSSGSGHTREQGRPKKVPSSMRSLMDCLLNRMTMVHGRLKDQGLLNGVPNCHVLDCHRKIIRPRRETSGTHGSIVRLSCLREIRPNRDVEDWVVSLMGQYLPTRLILDIAAFDLPVRLPIQGPCRVLEPSTVIGCWRRCTYTPKSDLAN
jgi:hypothetical protein